MNPTPSSTPAAPAAPADGLADLKVIAFDVFGTVVDWHGSIRREIEALRPDIDGAAFANAWRAGYAPAMQRVMSGELPWTRIDALHRMILDELLPRHGLADLDEADRVRLNRAWHRLQPWPDAAAGLLRLKSRYTICTLSNGNIGLLTDLSKHGARPWDCILSAEVFRRYKPDPATYLGVADIFEVAPSQVMLAAAHHDDLAAARHCGLLTAYIERPLEYGAGRPKDVSARVGNTLHAADIPGLADRLGVD